ncbi:cytosolic purine 5'-nucleotidase-like [Ostrea edulis]|uniref:cytosolic purine 5'-nucleotidase-like n=1 Tax=Ostrea edulis TaxID=37623 RepID=UPI0024AF2354|nr:cytosolic purine 5'-nucleotidase-like [Ostrea edulis]XP_056005626.1 cytosolic purine 5'-nucleotidase-like [Ostrea edulis]XP_056005627.1 cytosolic purine 5'-nucleotidase-like [Ostrea edulis]
MNSQTSAKRSLESSLSNGLPDTEMWKREPPHRVFVNRSLNLDKIKFFGFDMDYTLAVYKSPQYETMGFNMLRDRLVTIGYPDGIKDFEYDPTFPCRGLWFDKQYGNLLKVDAYGNILVCVHGFKFLKGLEIGELYPNKFVNLDEKRIYVLNTLFHLPETYMLACLIDYFTTSTEYERTVEGVRCGELYMSYKSIFQDVRAAVDWVHFYGNLKSDTVANMEQYVHKDRRLPVLLDRLRESGKKTIIITNSEYEYTNKIMEYLTDFPETKDRKWTSYFDYVVVDAKKPLFFEEGTILRKVDRTSNKLSIGHHVGKLEQHCAYSGGSCEVISQMIGAQGKDVLYVGDHIFGDILRSKKQRGWRTFLVVPELSTELHVWTDQSDLFNKIKSLEHTLSQIYKNLDSSNMEKPDISKIQRAMMDTVHELDLSYGMLGSLFRSGSRLTFFSSQVQRFADIYAASVINLIHYPFTYMFKAPAMLLPHESTVSHGETIAPADDFTIARQRSVNSGTRKCARVQHVPHVRPETPTKVTHHHDDDDFEETSSNSSDKSS